MLFIDGRLTLAWRENHPNRWDITWQSTSGQAPVEGLILPSREGIICSPHTVPHLPYDQMYLHEYALKNKQREGVLNSHGGNTVFLKKLGSSSCLHKHMFHFTLPFPDKCPTFIMGQHLQEWLYCAWFILCQWWYSSKQAKGCQYFLEGVWT